MITNLEKEFERLNPSEEAHTMSGPDTTVVGIIYNAKYVYYLEQEVRHLRKKLDDCGIPA